MLRIVKQSIYRYKQKTGSFSVHNLYSNCLSFLCKVCYYLERMDQFNKKETFQKANLLKEVIVLQLYKSCNSFDVSAIKQNDNKEYIIFIQH